MSANIYLLLDKIEIFLQSAIIGDIEFHRERKELYEFYKRSLSLTEPEERHIAISGTLHASIVGCLNAKQDGLKDDVKLAYITAISKLNTIVVQEHGVRKKNFAGDIIYRKKEQSLEKALKSVESSDGEEEKLKEQLARVKLGAQEAQNELDKQKKVNEQLKADNKDALAAIDRKNQQLRESQDVLVELFSDDDPKLVIERLRRMVKPPRAVSALTFRPDKNVACSSKQETQAMDTPPGSTGSEPKSTTIKAENQEVTNPQDSEVTPTVTHGDNVGKEQPGLLLTANVSPLSEGIDPYPSQGLEQVLGRQYLVDTFTWASTDAMASLKRTCSFPGLLYVVANIREKLDHYQFMRAGVEVTVRLNGTSFHQGALQIAWCPHYNSAAISGNNILYEQSLETLSNCPHSILSANTNATVSFTIPYIAPSRFWNLKDSPSNGLQADGWMGKVWFSVLAPLLLSGTGSTPSLTVNVFARFVDIQVSGATLRDASMENRELTKEELIAKLKELTSKEVMSKINGGKACSSALITKERKMPDGAKCLKVLKKIDELVNKKVGPDYSCVVMFCHKENSGQLKEKLQKFLNGGHQTPDLKPQRKVDPKAFLVEEISQAVSSRFKTGKKKPVKTRGTRYAREDDEDEEMDLKTEFADMGKQVATGLKKSIKKSVVDISSLGIDALGGLLDSGLGFLADKPTDNAPPIKIVNDLFTNITNCDGLDGGVKLAVSPTNSVSNDPSLYGQTRDYCRFENYKMLPGIIAWGTWAAADAQEHREFVIPVNPQICNSLTLSGSDVLFYLPHIGNLASFFKYWRGSMKYHLIIFTNKYTTGRLVIKHIPDPTYNSAIANAVFGDTFSHQIDVTGDTSYSFTIPYLAQTSWLRTSDPLTVNTNPVTTWGFANGQIAAYVMAPLANGQSTVTPQANWVLYASGGPDFEVACPTNPGAAYGDGTGLLTLSDKEKEINEKVEQEFEKINSEAKQPKIVQYGNKNKACSAMTSPLTGVDLSLNPRALFEQPFPTLVETKVTIPQKVSMGEEVTSWTQLMRRMSLYMYSTTVTISAGINSKIYPWSYVTGRLVDNHGVAPGIVQNGYCQFSRAMRTFHYRRGSIRCKVQIFSQVTDTTDPVDIYLIIAPGNVADVTSLAFGTPEAYGEGIVMQQCSNRRAVEAEVPFYCPLDMVCNAVFFGETDVPMILLQVNDHTSSSANKCSIRWFIGAGDDWSMGWPMTPVVVAHLFAPEESKK